MRDVSITYAPVPNVPARTAAAGSPVALVRTRAEGVPRAGVTKVGEVEKTKLVEVVPVVPAAVNPVILLKQVIVALEQLVPPLATGRTPVTPVVSGRPVKLVATPDAGVPRAGVVRIGEVKVLLVRVWVAARVTTVSEDPGKANDVLSVPVNVKELLAVRVLPSAIVKVAVVAGAVSVTLLIVVAVATPKTGVVSVGDVAKTRAPEPVSSSIRARSSEEASISVSRRTLPVVAPEVSRAILPVTSGKVYVRSAVRSAVVMMPANLPAPVVNGNSLKSSSVAVAERRTRGAVPPAAVKMFWAEVAREVPVATPSTGVTRVGVLAKTKAPLPVSSEITPSN